MALAIDASTPAIASTASAISVTTASFTPPSGSLIVLLYTANEVVNTDCSVQSVTNTGTAITWSRLVRKNTNASSTGGAGTSGGAEIWAGVGNGSAITVTVTGLNSGTGRDKVVQPVVLTGADTASLTNVAAAFSASLAAPTVTVTGCAAGSYVLACNSDWNQSGLGTVGSGQTMITEYDLSGQLSSHNWRTTSPLGGAGSQTMNQSSPTQQYNIVALEVRDASAVVPAVSRVAVTTGAPASAAAFAITLPSHAAGDRLICLVTGKDQTATVPTINQGWVLVGSGTGGTGTTGNDTGQTFWAAYAKDATSGSETAPTVTPGATAPNSWEWICAGHRPATGYAWRDAITASAPWVTSASDTTTASPLTGTAGAWTNVQPTDGDAIFAAGVIPTDLGTALGATTLTATGLSGGTKDTATTQYVENALGNDTAAVWAGWTGITGTASAGLAMSFTVTGATLQAGSLVAIAVRQFLPVLPDVIMTTIRP